MSIASEITRLQGVKGNILQAIADKGVEVPSGSMLADCPDLIAGIGSGGSGGVPYLRNIKLTSGVKVVDENGYVGGDFLAVYYPNPNYSNNFAIVVPGADYSGMGLGSVVFADSPVTIGGRSYRTVTIGNATWLAENLDYKFQVDGSQIPIGVSGTPTTPSAWYYGNDETTYGVDGNKYGLLYNWYATKYLEDNKSTLLPDGWRVPSATDWDTLATAVGGEDTAGTILKSAVGWTTGAGTDDYGFGGVPAGFYSLGSFYSLGLFNFFWTPSDIEEDVTRIQYLGRESSLGGGTNPKTDGASVRLVKDS